MYWRLAGTVGTEIAWSERESERASDSEAVSICETVQTQKPYYLCNTIIQDLHISLSIGDCMEREREREAMSICEMVKTQKWYYFHNTRSGYFPREREREVMSIHEMVKTQKWYYLHNMRFGYFPINRRLHRERKREREQERERSYVHL